MEKDFHLNAGRRKFRFARENRKSQTVAEGVLWEALRNRKLSGFKFRRQHPIADFIADFYCHECRLIVEIDGNYHDDFEQRQYDEGRTYELEDLGIEVMRFTNDDVINHLPLVLNRIRDYLESFSSQKE
jgi:very-short-patch-repair endonuclease